MTNTESTIVGFAGGLLTALFSGAVANKIGWLHFGVMQKAHQLNVDKATNQRRLQRHVEERQVLSDAYPPNMVLHVTVYNEGELAARKLDGYWRLFTHNMFPSFPSRPIQLDHLGKNPFRDEYCVSESVNWIRAGVKLRVEVTFTYISHPCNSEVSYDACYEYDPASRTMIRCASL